MTGLENYLSLPQVSQSKLIQLFFPIKGAEGGNLQIT